MTYLEMSATDRRFWVDAILDVLIPGGEGMPSARSVATSAGWLPTALDLRPDLAPLLGIFLVEVEERVTAGQTVAGALRALAVASQDDFVAVSGLLAGAYYMDPAVRASLAYPGQEARRLADDTGDYVDLLERVVERGPVYRPTPRTAPVEGDH